MNFNASNKKSTIHKHNAKMKHPNINLTKDKVQWKSTREMTERNLSKQIHRIYGVADIAVTCF